jgi:hypothetical protein
MRAVFSMLGLLAVVLAVGLLAKKQMAAFAPTPAPSAAAVSPATPPASPQQQVQQFKQSLDAAMQQARPLPDDPDAGSPK